MRKLKTLLNDQTLIKWSLFCIITAALLYILYFVIKNFSSILGGAASAVSSVCSALSPLFIGIVVAYLMSPAVSLIDNKVLARTFFKPPGDSVKAERRAKLRFLLSIIITFLLLIAAVCAIVYGFAIMIIGNFVFTDFQHMFEDVVSYFTTYETALREWVSSLPQDTVSEKINDAISVVADWFSNSFQPASIVNFAANIGGGVIKLVLGVIVGVYLLKDKRFFLGICRKFLCLLLPKNANAAVLETLNEINTVISQFVRGALLDALIIAILSSVALSVLGLQFSVFIGCFAGIANIIPYFGPLLGMIPAFAVGMFTDGLTQGVLAVVLMLAIQQLDSNFIYPKIVGSTVGLHPLFVLLAITVAGHYGGIIGMVIAVPIAGILKIFILKFTRRVEGEG